MEVYLAASRSDLRKAALREAAAREPDIDWPRVTAFHVDEYLDLFEDAPQRFGTSLTLAFFNHAHLDQEASSLLKTS